MYIQPDTDVWLLENVPLDPSYTSTVLWASAQEQREWFTSHAKFMFTGISYQRHNTNTLRLEIAQEEAMQCNYMCFTNKSFGDKMFYAFITDVTYVSNTVSEITFQLDVMQSFQHEWMIAECWVEREHTESDEPGEHTLPEPVDFGDYVVGSFRTEKAFDTWGVMINSVFKDS